MTLPERAGNDTALYLMNPEMTAIFFLHMHSRLFERQWCSTLLMSVPFLSRTQLTFPTCMKYN